MNTFDLFILIPIALGLIFGIFKGFVKEVVSLVGIVLAWLAAEMFSNAISPFMGSFFNLSEKMAKTTSYLLIFILTILAALLLSRLTDKLLHNISLGWLNSILGGFFGALKVAIVVSVMMNAFDALDSRFNFANPEKKQASLCYYPILKLAPSLWKETKRTYDKSRENHQDKTEKSEKRLMYE
ncbi:MAG: CvpA family protein [Paludibacteraceae bacterium]